MAIPKSYAMKFSPKGLVDAYDASDKFPGACRQLTDLIFDPSNPELVYSRPGVISVATFNSAGFNQPTNITIQGTIGQYTFGMVTTQRFPGFDEPFMYNNASGTFVTIANVLATNVPASQPTVGDWIPPQLTQVGIYIIIAHAGYSLSLDTANFTGTITGTVLAISALTGPVTLGAAVAGAGVMAGTTIQASDGGNGVAGNYFVNLTQTVGPVAMSLSNNIAFGAMDISTITAPVWYGANLGVNPLTAVPTSVANFNNRAYFAFITNNALAFGDDLLLQRTMASQQLTIGDYTGVTALTGLPIATTSSGAVQSLTVFKATQVWQVTGDFSSTLQPLAQNFLSLTIGTTSPRSVCQSLWGLYFATAYGPYFIDPIGTVRPLTHSVQDADQDIILPFLNCTAFTRIAGAFAGSIWRVCIPTIFNGVGGSYDFWFDERPRRWTGPHSFRYDCASQYGNQFILCSNTMPAQLFLSSPQQSSSTVFTDNNTTVLNPVLFSSTFPKTQQMTQKQVVESTQELATGASEVVFAVSYYDEQGNLLNTVDVQVQPNGILWGSLAQDGSGALWGTIAEGGTNAQWASSVQVPHVYSCPWSAPIVFQKVALNIQGVAGANMVIGTHHARYQDTGYMNLTSANTP